MREKIVVLGGGTAGWMTALFVRHILPQAQITLIKSNEVDVIGVGEATTPHFVNFLQMLGIDVLHFINETNGSIKNGINFVNWNGDGKKYLHPFLEFVSDFSIPNLFDTGCGDYYLKNLIRNNLPFEEYTYSYKLSYNNKIDLEKMSYACHFDSALLSNYLEKIGVSRNINQIEGHYQNLKTDEQGYITDLCLTDGRLFECDFVFDCSGFSRLLIGNHFKEQWISYSNHLPMKKAIPFWLDSVEDIPPYTTATAMKNGWIWQIPLQDRIGSGYVFDTDYISVDEAHQEAEELFNKKLTVRKVIDFNAGRYKNCWVKNCMAIGLSSSFIEPLESTSLYVILLQFGYFKHFINELKKPKDQSIKTYNKIISDIMEDVLSFVYFHYITKRNDSEFWKKFKKNYSVPKKLKDILDSIENGHLAPHQISSIFPLFSYLHVGRGLNLFENGINTNNYDLVNPSPFNYNLIINGLENQSLDHSRFLKYLKEKYK